MRTVHGASSPFMTSSSPPAPPGNLRAEILQALRAPEIRTWLIAAAVLTALFSPFLYRLFDFALDSNLYSHIPLMPVIALYLIWQDRALLPPHRATLPRYWAGAAALAGTALSAAYGIQHWSGDPLPVTDALALATGGYLLLLLATGLAFLDAARLRQIAFPAALLVFMVPFPDAVESAIETVLQHGSADVAYALFEITGTPLFRNELIFQLPNITLEVAPQCSGIHSTLALFITSLVAGYLFLRAPRHRAILAFIVIPLAFVRNGFRVFVLGELCVRIGPEMIHSFVHHRGGPLFFALSLIPFSLVLFYLVRRERRLFAAPSALPNA